MIEKGQGLTNVYSLRNIAKLTIITGCLPWTKNIAEIYSLSHNNNTCQ